MFGLLGLERGLGFILFRGNFNYMWRNGVLVFVFFLFGININLNILR